VENHHGIITATGKLDKGARFDIYIPTNLRPFLDLGDKLPYHSAGQAGFGKNEIGYAIPHAVPRILLPVSLIPTGLCVPQYHPIAKPLSYLPTGIIAFTPP
jgi:hypothetical protein